jgi:integrase
MRKAVTTLTQRAVDAAQPTGKVYAIGDAGCQGLRLWVGATGAKRWQRRIGDKTLVLGDAATMSLADARALAMAPLAVATAAVATAALATLGSLVDHYLATEAAHLSRNTRRPRIVRQFLAGLLDRPVSALTRQWVIARQQQLLAEGYKGSSVVSYRKGASAFANWLVEHGHLDRTPFHRLPRVPVDESFSCLDDGGMRMLEVRCERHEELPMACAAMIAMLCGLRKGEVQKLEWRDFDMVRNRLTVRAANTKTRKGRIVGLPAKLVAFLAERRDRLPDHRPFNVPSFDWRWDRLRRQARLAQHITFHGLRHSYASALLRRGASLEVIRQALGHGAIAVTARYVHALHVEVTDAAKLFDLPMPKSMFEGLR